MAITASEASRDLERLIERVNLDHIGIEIISERGAAVLISKDEYDSLAETIYLRRSPANAKRLLAAIKATRNGASVERLLLELDPKALPSPEHRSALQCPQEHGDTRAS